MKTRAEMYAEFRHRITGVPERWRKLPITELAAEVDQIDLTTADPETLYLLREVLSALSDLLLWHMKDRGTTLDEAIAESRQAAVGRGLSPDEAETETRVRWGRV